MQTCTPQLKLPGLLLLVQTCPTKMLQHPRYRLGTKYRDSLATHRHTHRHIRLLSIPNVDFNGLDFSSDTHLYFVKNCVHFRVVLQYVHVSLSICEVIVQLYVRSLLTLLKKIRWKSVEIRWIIFDPKFSQNKINSIKIIINN